MNTVISKDLLAAQQLLEQGQVVGVPTETVYGLAANALNEEAVVKIFEAKNRPLFDPLIVHLAHKDQVDLFAGPIPPKARLLADAFWPGPLTLVLPRRKVIPDLVTAGLETVGVRVPSHPVMHALLRALSFPLAAPSANPFGYISPTSAQHVYDQLQGKISMVLDGGSSEVGVESTIIQCTDGEVYVLRLGGISTEALEKIVGPVNIQLHSTSNPQAPGMLTSHYAPRKKMIIGNLDVMIREHHDQDFAVLSFKKDHGVKTQRILSESGSTGEAARNLFRMMRELDATDAGMILAEYVPEEGLGKAINDRLSRAAHQGNSFS